MAEQLTTSTRTSETRQFLAAVSTIVESGNLDALSRCLDRAHESLEIARERGTPPHKLAQVKGILAGMRGDLPGAEALLRESLDRTPANATADSAQTAWNLGYCLERQEKFGEAAEAYRTARRAGYHRVNCSIAAGRCLRKKGDLEELEHLARTVSAGSICGLGKTAPNPVLSTLRYFRREYEAHLEGRCPAGKCKELIRYRITDDCIGCTLCAQHCPVEAIPVTPYRKHTIDDAICTRCDTCREVCPTGAVVVE